jgi:hypothetical protein
VNLGIGRRHTSAENKCTIEEKVHQMGRKGRKRQPLPIHLGMVQIRLVCR